MEVADSSLQANKVHLVKDRAKPSIMVLFDIYHTNRVDSSNDCAMTTAPQHCPQYYYIVKLLL